MIAFDLFHLIFGASMIELITDPTPGKISYFREILEAEGIRGVIVEPHICHVGYDHCR